MKYNERIEQLIAEEMKRRLEVERTIAKEAGVQTGEISKRFAGHHAVLQKYFDTDQRKMSGYNYFRMMKKQGKADGEWNSLSQAAKGQYEAQAKKYEDCENAEARIQAVSRAVRSVKSIMKVANDVYSIPSVFIHGLASEETTEAADTSSASGVHVGSSFLYEGGDKISDFTKSLRNSHKRKFEESFVPDDYVFPARSCASKADYYARRDAVTNIIKQKLVDCRIHTTMKQNIRWTKMILPESQGKGIECHNWPANVPFEGVRGMDAIPFGVLEEALKNEKTLEGQEMTIYFRERVE